MAPGEVVPLHPEAATFADHFGFTIDVLPAYQVTGKGWAERQVDIGREHALVGRGFDSLAQRDVGSRRGCRSVTAGVRRIRLSSASGS